MDFLNLPSNEILLIFHLFANGLSILIFSIVLASNLSQKNLETKNLYFNAVIISQLLFFVFEIIWAVGYFNDFPNRIQIIRYSKMLYFIFGGFAAFFWFIYIEILMGAKFSKTKKGRLLIAIPMCISTITTIIISIITDDVKIVKNPLVSISQMYIPFTYVIIACIISLIMAIRTKNRDNKKRYASLGFYPVGLVFFSTLQVFFIEIPILNLGTSLLIIALYIFKIQSQVSTDALTGINNRSALTKYIGEYTRFNYTYVLMIDVDDFKSINDNFGHLEGDKALVILADSLKNGISKCSEKTFLARYGGDEFIIIVSSVSDFEIEPIIESIEHEVKESKNITKKYELSVSIGYSKVDKNDSILKVINEADTRMYTNKSAKKKARGKGVDKR